MNVVYLLIFVTAGLGFTLLAAAFWALAEGAVAAGTSLQVVSRSPPLFFFQKVRLTFLTSQQGCGASWFVTTILGWYLLLTMFLSIMDYSLDLPVGDFSKYWVRSKSAKSMA